MPIIEVQRRMAEMGRIRAGEKGSRGEPRKLDKWRLTSKHGAVLEAAAELWGGSVREWKDHPGEYELYTGRAEIPIMLLPGALPSTWFELWSAGGCQRRCDGQHELVSDSGCICATEEERQCKPTTRLALLLPDLPGIGSWLLQSHGWNAAAELAGSADLLQRGAAAGVLLPAQLRLEQRTQVKGGQTRRFAVPVIDIGSSFNQFLAAGGTDALPPAPQAGGTPIEAGARRELEAGGTSVAEGLRAVEPRPEVAPRANAAEPLGEPVAEAEVGASPDAPDESEEVSSAPAAAPTGADGAGATRSGQSTTKPADAGIEGAAPTSSDEASEAPATPNDVDAAAGSASSSPPPAPQKPVTQAQKKMLNALYGELREVPMDGDGNVLGNPLVTVGGLYAWAAKQRNIEVELMIQLLEGRDEQGKLHFPPLRDSLTRAEASAMIDGLEGIKAKAAEAASSS